MHPFPPNSLWQYRTALSFVLPAFARAWFARLPLLLASTRSPTATPAQFTCQFIASPLHEYTFITSCSLAIPGLVHLINSLSLPLFRAPTYLLWMPVRNPLIGSFFSEPHRDSAPSSLQLVHLPILSHFGAIRSPLPYSPAYPRSPTQSRHQTASSTSMTNPFTRSVASRYRALPPTRERARSGRVRATSHRPVPSQ
ncbi:hypothetical protein B0H15DRAFT_851569 [Mycena belliarum]|uniref:Uncharacterized protein n=1 Tax=Mycena belliarum TaxID=1033014 RepID=A0AAD6U246_9AGAR|nr:hypothetical protein B0H15DRAFT_851569 [Mycena belliae]